MSQRHRRQQYRHKLLNSFNQEDCINLYQFLIFDIPLSLTIYNYLLPKEIQMSLLIRELDELNL